MASAIPLGIQTRPSAALSGLAPYTARLLQAGWLLLLLGAVAVASAATPALHARFQIICPEPICDVLPQPNTVSVQRLDRLGISLHDYASVMVGVEWLGILVWGLLGAVIIWKRPRDFIGLLLAYSGVVGASKLFLDTLSAAHPGAIVAKQTGLLITAIALPLIVALFPDGRWIPRWTCWVAATAIAYGVATVFADEPLPGLLGVLEIPLGVVPFVVLLGAQIYRFRRVSSREQRQQAKWLLFGVSLLVLNIALAAIAIVLGFAAPFQLVFVAFCYGAFLLMGISITVAILRYRLFDIDIIVNRTLVYSGLTAAVAALYALVVTGLGIVFQARGEPAIALVATGVVAVAFAPLRDLLQRGVNRLLYGYRDDPYAVLTRLGRQLEATIAPEEILPAIVRTMTETLRLPYAAITLAGNPAVPVAAAGRAAAGRAAAGALHLPLLYQAESVGELIVAPRGPGEAFAPADERLLADLARQIGVAVHTVRLTADLQRSRERIVATREEERRRLRRDLHDGLGAQLAALAMQAGALRATIARDPVAAQEQAAELRGELRAAVADIRRLVHGLRPPALDELGLVGALRQQADRFTTGGIRYEDQSLGVDAGFVVTVIAPEDLSALPAAVEVAVYRIVEEALANVARHAAARVCLIRLEVDGVLTLTIEDDGCGMRPDHGFGVGLHSMRERAEELGGCFAIAPRAAGPGTRLAVALPLPTMAEG